MSGKTGRRPCACCRCWFTPNPRVGKRQRACAKPECQRERHRQACARQRKRDPERDAADRLRRKLGQARQQETLATNVILPEVWWKVARDVVGAKFVVVVQECAKVLDRRARDGVPAMMGKASGSSSKVLGLSARDGLDAQPGTP